MNKDSDINKLRFLLHKYYEAQTTPEEENQIVSLFSKIEVEDIPNDLAFDRKLFLSMKEIIPDPTNLEIPDDLFGKINQEIAETSSIASIERKKKWKKPFVYAGSVAAACLLFAICIQIIFKSSILKSPTIENLAENPVESPKDSLSKISDPLPTKTIAEKSEQKQSRRSSEHHSNQTMAEIGVLPNEENGYIEITDPEEAREIIVEIGRLLANNSRKTNEATLMVENAVNEYKEITKSILK